MAKIDLNAPAFGKNAQKMDEITKETEPTVDPVVTEPAKEEEPVVTSEEETKVPYSRFKKFHDRALEAEAREAEWRAKAEALTPTRERTNAVEDLPEYWKKLYGDSEASKEAWSVQKQANAELREEARREAIEAVRNERLQEIVRTEENVEVLDENFEDLSAMVGRALTDREQSAVLDIVDEYTPKDREGNYTGDILPFEKAWEIYELKQANSKSTRTAQRDSVAGLSGTRSEGEPSQKVEQDKNWNPLDWNAYKRKL